MSRKRRSHVLYYVDDDGNHVELGVVHEFTEAEMNDVRRGDRSEGES